MDNTKENLPLILEVETETNNKKGCIAKLIKYVGENPNNGNNKKYFINLAGLPDVEYLYFHAFENESSSCFKNGAASIQLPSDGIYLAGCKCGSKYQYDNLYKVLMCKPCNKQLIVNNIPISPFYGKIL